MTILRRSRTPQPPPVQGSGIGVMMMRRVELKSSSIGKHWYMETLTDYDAIHRLAGAFKPRANPANFHVVDRYARK